MLLLLQLTSPSPSFNLLLLMINGACVRHAPGAGAIRGAKSPAGQPLVHCVDDQGRKNAKVEANQGGRYCENPT